MIPCFWRVVVLPVILYAIFMIGQGVCASVTEISLSATEQNKVDQGEIVVREVASEKKEGRTFEVVGLIKASKEDIVQVLSDYGEYPQFMPNVSKIKIVEEVGDEAVLNYTLTLPLKKIKKYRLKMRMSEPEPHSVLITWNFLKWPGLKESETIRDTSGYWNIQEQAKERSLVLYHVYTDPGSVPFGTGWIVDVLSKKSVPEVFLQTKKRVEGAK